MNATQLDQVRRFNRTITQRIGALQDDYLGSGIPLGLARLLFEIGPGGTTARDLRARLDLDSGYLSRMLRSLEAAKLASTKPDPSDARVRRIVLTAKGRKQWAALDTRSNDLAASLLAPLGSTQRERLLAAMGEVERVLRMSAVTVVVADPFSATARACIEAYYAELAARFDGGFDPSLTVSADPEGLVPPAGRFVLATLDGQAVGCGALKVHGQGVGEIKRMWVSPSARGLGVGQRLLEALEGQAVAAGIDVLRLDTNRRLPEARQLYERNGYSEIAAYNRNPYAHHWYEKRRLQALQV